MIFIFIIISTSRLLIDSESMLNASLPFLPRGCVLNCHFLHVFKVCPLTHGIPSCIRWASPLNMVSVLPVWSSCACVDMTGYRCTHWSLFLFLLQVLFRFWQYLYSGIVLSDLECCAVVVYTFQLNSCLIIFLHTFCIIWCFIFGSNQNVSLVN